jgi:hypothetical protein
MGRRVRSLVIGLAVTPVIAGAQAELRVGLLSSPTIRNAAFGTGATQGNGTGGVFELVARLSYVGLHVRTQTADFGSQLGLSSGDVRLLVGPQIFTAEVGGTRRVFSGPLSQVTLGLTRIGLRSTFLLGGSGLRGSIGGWALSGSTLPVGVEKVEGIEGETSLQYLLPKLPAYLQVGYRREVLNVTYTTRKGPEEVGALVLGGGILFGGGRR